MKPKTIILKAEVEAISSRKDKTLKLTFGTQEIKEGAELFNLQNKMVSLGINVLDITDEDIELLASNKFGIEDLPNRKSLSKQYRDVLYIYWKQHDTGFDTYEEFYKDHYTKRINNVKSKLEP
jgi:hypothetical protein